MSPHPSSFDRYQAGGTPSQTPMDDDPKAPAPERVMLPPEEAMTYQGHACRIVFNYVAARLEKTDTHVKFEPIDVFVVWFTYVLGSWKALVSTTLADGMYYEVTHNNAKGETYLDAYKKWENVCYSDSSLDLS